MDDLRRSVEAIPAEEAKWANANLEDETVLQSIANRKLKHSLLPEQLRRAEDAIEPLSEALKQHLATVRQEISNHLATEQGAAIETVAKDIAKHCRGSLEIARGVATSLPAVTDLNAKANWSTREPGADRATGPESYDRAVIDHASELLAILDRFESQGRSFAAAA